MFCWTSTLGSHCDIFCISGTEQWFWDHISHIGVLPCESYGQENSLTELQLSPTWVSNSLFYSTCYFSQFACVVSDLWQLLITPQQHQFWQHDNKSDVFWLFLEKLEAELEPYFHFKGHSKVFCVNSVAYIFAYNVLCGSGVTPLHFVLSLAWKYLTLRRNIKMQVVDVTYQYTKRKEISPCNTIK